MTQIELFYTENKANDWLRRHPEVLIDSIQVASTGGPYGGVCVMVVYQIPEEPFDG